MSANGQTNGKQPSNQHTTPSVTTGPLPGSSKIYQPSLLYPGLKVAMREIAVHPTAGEPPVRVYDPSGPYTDPNEPIDIQKGLKRIRAGWAEARGDVESYVGRDVKPEDNGFAKGDRLVPEFPVKHQPLRAKDGKAITSDHGVLHGISRRTVLEICEEMGIETEVRPLPMDEFMEADEVFISTSGGGVAPIRKVKDRVFSNDAPGPVTMQLYDRFQEWLMRDELRPPV